mmetsp:Transcript_24130/g.40275  ORF Transcript_24130/g.40275 Transcript_24130/m.40275 type:complete len:98 (+) Transcript_24130:126-419(+)
MACTVHAGQGGEGRRSSMGGQTSEKHRCWWCSAHHDEVVVMKQQNEAPPAEAMNIALMMGWAKEADSPPPVVFAALPHGFAIIVVVNPSFIRGVTTI